MLVWLLRRLSSRDAANAAVGDAFEELSARRAVGRAPRFPHLWMTLQLLRSIAAAVGAGFPRFVRAMGLVVRDAFRSLRTAPAQSLFIVLVLMVGITAGTVTYSVVDAVLLKPLPIADGHQVVSIATRDEARKQRVTSEVYWQLKERLTSVQVLVSSSFSSGRLSTLRGVTDDWMVAQVQLEAFAMYRLRTGIGRLWTEEEQAGAAPVAVLGYRVWRERFGSDPSILGDTITAGEGAVTYRVIGVLSAESDHPEVNIGSAGYWVPKVIPRTGRADLFGLTARMRPGVTPAQVAEEIRRIEGSGDWLPTVTPIMDSYVSRVRRWMLLALGAAGLVVLVACVNAANLMLSRCAGRVQEIAVRASLGASRARIVATVLLEGLLLSAAATAGALLLSLGGVRVARNVLTGMPLGVFRGDQIAVNGRVLMASVAVTMVTGLVVALIPAWQTARTPLSSLLKDAAGATSTGRRRWRSVFLTSEVAIVVILLVVSSLFVVSLARVFEIDLGIDRTNLVAVKPNIEFQGTVLEVRQRLESLPGVTGVAVSMGTSLPLVGRAFGGAYHEVSLRRVDAESAGPDIKALDYRVTPNYFEVAGLKFVRGGTWREESIDSAPAAVLDQRVARALFGDGNPIGRPIKRSNPDRVYTVVGVVPFAPTRGPEEENLPSIYFPVRVDPKRAFAGLFVRTTRPAGEMVPVITEALAPFAPRQKMPYVFGTDEALSRITATRRFNTGLMSLFGLVGVLIGAAGVYAVMASFVVQQTREIGVRLALGATRERILTGVLSLAGRHLLMGFAIGVPAAWWLSRGFTALLFQVTPADVSIYVGVAVILAAIGLVAAWVPARRASQVDPIICLKSS